MDVFSKKQNGAPIVGYWQVVLSLRLEAIVDLAFDQMPLECCPPKAECRSTDRSLHFALKGEAAAFHRNYKVVPRWVVDGKLLA